MPLENILQKAKQQRDDRQAEAERIVSEKLAIETQRLEVVKVAFENELKKYVGDILTELSLSNDINPAVVEQDEDIMPPCYDSLCCKIEIRHRIIRLGVKRFSNGKPIQWLVCDSVSEDFAAYQRFIPASESIKLFATRKEYVTTEDLHEFLLLVILETQEEYDRLLPEFQAASAKLAQEKTTERLLAEYRRAIEEAVKKSNQEIAALKTVLKEWQWPEDRQLKLYKITWAKHGFLDSSREAHFDYEFGWALSDIPRSFTGYYELLPERNKTAREVKPGYPVTVECYYFTEDTLPEELLEKVTQQIDIVKVHDHIFDDWKRVLSQFLPELPFEIADNFEIEPKTAILDLPVPPKPCLEIRLALSLSNAATDDGSAAF